MSAHFKTNYSELGPNWLLSNGSLDIKTAKIDSYSKIGESIPEFTKTQKLLKNQVVASKWKEVIEEAPLDELSKEKRRLDQNALKAKKFPIKPENLKYPEHGLNVGNPFYFTSYMVIGKLKPSNYDITERYFPVNKNFTGQFGGGNYKFDGLNTSQAFSKVHKLLDEY